MLWWRYPQWAGRLMTAWFLLSLVTGPVISVNLSTGSAGASILGRLVGWAFSAFLARRVTRGGRISRMLLILANGSRFIEVVIGLGIQPRSTALGILALLAVQVSLLLSPAVFQRTRPAAQPGARLALWRRRTPVPLVTALAAAAVIGLTGLAVSASVVHGRDSQYDSETLHVRAGHPAGAILPPGRYAVLGGCDFQSGCDDLKPRDLSIRPFPSGTIATIRDPGGERDVGGEQFFQDLYFTVPVSELVEFTLNGHPRAPALIIPAQDKAAAVRRWQESEAAFGLLLLGSLAGLAWPVRRGVAGRW